ncbi:MAG TPA: polysaccharide biosynthesis tyrosine autokinase [Candidatus Acidoferrales bacterium]|nr:polysaccharide biosynthesis tyrosine autokinase [Candidatus Acidoferrales bacterium]
MEPKDKLARLESDRMQAPGIQPSTASMPPQYGGTLEFEQVHLRDYLRVLRKYRLTIFLFVLTTVLTVLLVSLRLTKMYEAVVRVAIDRENPSTLMRESTVPTDPWSFQDYLRTQIRVLESDTMAMLTIRTLRLDREPEFRNPKEEGAQAAGPLPVETPLDANDESRLIRQFQGNLRISAVPNSWLIEIHYYSRDPQLAARIANAHANNFIEHNFRTRYEATMKASEWLSDQLRELRSKVEASESQLVDFERRYNLVSIDERQNVLTQRLSDLNHELSQAEADRAQKESVYRQAASGKDPSLFQDSLTEKLQYRLSELQAQHAEARTQFGPQHPRMQRLEEQIKEVDGLLARQQQIILGRLQEDYQSAVKREKLVRDLVEKQKAEVNELNQRLIEYNVIKREVTTNKQLYDGLQQQLNEAGISAGLRSSNIRVVDPARIPMFPYSPNVFFNVLLAIFLSVPVGVALAFFREYLDNTVKNPDEVERYSGLPTMALVPLAESSASHPKKKLLPISTAGGNGERSEIALVTYEQPQSSMAEAFRSLRTAVLLSSAERPPRLLLVTSGQPSDGKTATAINLAVALAQRGGKVVLVEADLRKPSAHKVLHVDGKHGLSLFLSGTEERNGLVVPTSVSNLYFIPAGPVPPNPAELLSSARMKQLLGELTKEYDHIILDSPPLLSITDATVLSVMVDGVVLVVRFGKTTREVLRHMRQMLHNVNARVLGVVLNGVALNSVDYYYYYYSYYGYGYRQDDQQK